MLFVFSRARRFAVLCLLSAGIYLSFATLVETRFSVAFAESSTEEDTPVQIQDLGLTTALIVGGLAILALSGCKDTDKEKKEGEGVSEAQCKILIKAAEDNPMLDVPAACKKYQTKQGQRLNTLANSNAYDLLNESILDLRHFGVKALKLKPTIKTGNEKRPNGQPVSLVANLTDVTGNFFPLYINDVKKGINDLNSRLSQVASKESIGAGDILLLDADYAYLLNRVEAFGEQVNLMTSQMVFEPRKTGEFEEIPAILGVTPNKSLIPSNGGKVKVEVIIDDPDTLIDAASVKLEIMLGGKTLKELSLKEEASDPDAPGLRKFSVSWKAPKNLTPKAVKYALKAAASKTDKSGTIKSGDRSGTFSVKGGRPR